MTTDADRYAAEAKAMRRLVTALASWEGLDDQSRHRLASAIASCRELGYTDTEICHWSGMRLCDLRAVVGEGARLL